MRKLPPKKKFDKYWYYENSVQTPEEHVRIFEKMFYDIRKKDAVTLKEDFCGTFLISCEWARSRPYRKAIGVDLDPEPIEYGKVHGFKKLTSAEKKRVSIRQLDVCQPQKDKVQIIGAGNFSFFVFKTREQIKRYFKAALKNLERDGIFVLEMAGGAGFIHKTREQRTIREGGLGKYTYYWDQKYFDPITHHGLYAIHFREKNGTFHKDVFTYDWRVWTIPEVRELMLECGFKEAVVYWETADDKGEGSGEYVQMAEGENDFSWIAFVVGIK